MADEFMLEQLMFMGFEPVDAANALVVTNNKSVEAALDFLEANKAIDPFAERFRSNMTKSNKPSAPTQNKSNAGKGKEGSKAPVNRMEDSDEDSEEEAADSDASMEGNSDNEEFIDEDEIFDEAEEETELATVLDSEQLQQTASGEIERISSITETSLATAGALLRVFQWNSEKLLESYYENPEKVLKQAGLVAATPAATTTSSTGQKKSADCEVCGDALTKQNSSALECGHSFCNDCLRQYLTIQVGDGKSLDITCMSFKCKGSISDTLIKTLVDPKTYDKYKAFVLKSFVEDNPNVKWCPRAGCGNAVKSDTTNLSDAQCSCGYKFCFKCNGEAHAPAMCIMMKLWAKKCKDDSETSNWISANTKDCPKCNSAIEKNGGCNHMTCRKCKNEFCWICGAPWAGHSACNKYNADDSKKSQDRAALDRYLHYFHRYNAHEQSSKFESALREAGLLKMVSMQKADEGRWIDVQFIDAGTEQLIECRRAMKYTYVFAFYLRDGPEKNLFEYLQAQLEETTEQLSGALEAPVGTKEPRQIKDITQLAHKRLLHLVEGVADMMETKHNLPLITEVLALIEHKEDPPAKKAAVGASDKPSARPSATSVEVPPATTKKSGGIRGLRKAKK